MAIQSSSSSESAAEFEGLSQKFLSHPQNPSIWESLQQAIAASSGFQRWQLERNAEDRFTGLNLDHRVGLYLRETLETLAY